MTTILLTGAAGFIGFHVAERLLRAEGAPTGARVIGLDNLSAYYDVGLKRARLAGLSGRSGFSFHEIDVADHERLADLVRRAAPEVVIHLAAQAGVRHSILKPFDYASANLTGHLSVLEACRHAEKPPRLVYASSSSVYGGNAKVPFAEDDPVDHPISLYAATKRADELMSDAYAHLYRLPQVGLRFFTVYGPWGRPDMAYWTFTEKLLKGEPIPVFNNGDLKRDFTFIDDIVSGVVAVATQPLNVPPERPHRIYNIGNNHPVPLLRFIEVLEAATGQKAIKDFRPMQPGDVPATFADIGALARDHGFRPSIPIEEGLPRFVDWFRAYHRL